MGSAWLPVGGDLQDGRAAEAAMREEQFFAERLAACGGENVGRDAGEIAETGAILRREGERHEGRAALLDVQAELAGDA